MITTPIDNLNFKNDPEIKAMIGHEDIYYSGKIIKIHKGFFTSNQERTLLITDQALYNLKEKNIKRRIEIGNIKGISISGLSEQFIIHGKDENYDYLYSSPNRLKIIEILELIYESVINNELLFTIKYDKDLSKYVAGKKEKTRNPELFKIESKQFMSIREFIESEGNLRINPHLNSLLLEEEFNKETFYKKESLSNFKLLRIIGKGKNSIIYLANYEGENVALKIFDKIQIYKNELIEAIILEKNILTSFTDKKFLCHMKFYFTTETKIVFVLPFFQGGDLFNMLLVHKRFDETTVAFFATQIANMIYFLHSKNIAYRDLKLENIMINENGYLTLIDFGSCKVIEDPNELESSFIGSTDYMSPEIVNGDGHNIMTDWWSFGILIYELLIGIPPFHEDKIERCFELITTANLKFPSKIRLHPDTKDIIIRLLKKNPNERMGKGRLESILSHPFFDSINTKYILIQKTNAPRKPIINPEDITSNFDKIYTNLNLENIEKEADISLLNQISSLFEEFEK